MSEQGVANFYKHQNIFITGGTGFLGICLLEKILRTCPDHGNIYLLLRPKRGKEISERLEAIKTNQIFERLLQEKNAEQAFSKVSAVAGDVGEENLGLSTSDRKILTDHVNVIFHSAATLDFGDSLKTTVDINLLGTRRVTELAKECSKLKVLVHVSSAYVNSWRLEADEVIYPLQIDSNELIATVNKLTPKELEAETPKLLAEHPNTYTITKHAAEHEIQKVEKLFPCTIVRPSMITAAWVEPVPGWTISKNGPQGFLMGASRGVIRRLPVGQDLIYDYIPVDTVVNNLLVAGFHAATLKSQKVEVFHCTSSTRNPFRWASVNDKINTYLHEYPLKSAVWYPHLKLLPSVLWYKISAIFVHFLPAIFLDLVAFLAGGRPLLLKLHTNVNSSLDRLEKFIFTEWKFSSTETEKLQAWLNSSDKETFNLDITTLKWSEYFVNLTIGVRVYLNKEPMKNLSSAKSKDHILYLVHNIFQFGVVVLLWWLVACIANVSMVQAVFAAPVIYGLMQLL